MKAPIWSCSKWGLPCHNCYQLRGALLPHLFTLTLQRVLGGIFSVALSVDFHLPGVTWHFALGARTFLHQKIWQRLSRLAQQQG